MDIPVINVSLRDQAETITRAQMEDFRRKYFNCLRHENNDVAFAQCGSMCQLCEYEDKFPIVTELVYDVILDEMNTRGVFCKDSLRASLLLKKIYMQELRQVCIDCKTEAAFQKRRIMSAVPFS